MTILAIIGVIAIGTVLISFIAANAKEPQCKHCDNEVGMDGDVCCVCVNVRGLS